MSEQGTHFFGDEINLKEFFRIFNKEKYKIILPSLAISLIVFVFFLFVKDVYRSSTILAPSNEESLSTSSQILNNFSSLSFLSNNDSDRSQEGVAIISSLDFFKNLLTIDDLKIKLLATKGWDKENNQLVFDGNIYNESNNSWVSNEEFSFNGVPSILESHEEFIDKLRIRTNLSNGFITLSFDHHSPYVAKEVLDNVIILINRIVREGDIKKYEQTIEYLNQQADKISFSNVQAGIFELIQNQIQKIAIAKSSENYMFKVLSSPYIAEEYIKPKRIIIFFVSFLASFIFLTITFLIKNLKS